MQDIQSKLTSRKFWVAVAAMLASVGTSIGGVVSDNQTLATVGVVCLIVSQAIYSFCEAYVDAASVRADTKTTTIQATSATTIAAVNGKEAVNG
jgi:hypothetical protein